jgi:hypothetical protein
MFISPFDLSISLWLTAVPEFETVLEPGGDASGGVPIDAGPVMTGSADAGSADAGSACPVNTLPRVRLVFKGMHWVACPVWSMRENPAWDQMSQIRREEDDQRIRQRSHASQPPVRPAAADDAAGAAPGAGAEPGGE